MLLLEAEKAIQVLAGMVKGLALDGAVTGHEIAKLREWIEAHPRCFSVQPFADLGKLIDQIDRDGELDASVAQEIVDYCDSWEVPNLAGFTSDEHARVLQGILDAIVADNFVSNAEARGLRSWIADLPASTRSTWPFSDLEELLRDVLADGNLSPAERERLRAFASAFALRLVHSAPPRARSSFSVDAPDHRCEAPLLESIHTIADQECEVALSGKRYCFTGIAIAGTRSKLSSMAKAAGATVVSRMSLRVDYLVIGDLSNPLWKFSTYGTKIQAVMENRAVGGHTKIIMEARFVEAVRHVIGGTATPT